MSKVPLATLLLLLGLCPFRSNASDTHIVVADVLTGVVPLGALGIAWQKDDKDGMEQWMWSTGVSLVLNSAARLAFNETNWGQRPNGHEYGFPSGHTSFIVSGAAFLSERYGWRYGVPAYIASAYVGWVRVDNDKHHWRDIGAAAALSWAVSHYLVTPYEDDKTAIVPLISPEMVGLQVEHRF